MNEIWKDVVGCEGFYEVSNLGRVRSVSRAVKTKGNRSRLIRGKIIIPAIVLGYPRVNICMYGKKINFNVHRLVALSFIPNPDGKPFVDHIDGSRDNNCVDNLRWTTVSENVLNPNTHYKTCGHNHFNYGRKYSDVFKDKLRKGHVNEHKPVIQYTKQGVFVKEYRSILDAERETGIDHSSISACCRNLKNHKSAGGYHWKYVI